MPIKSCSQCGLKVLVDAGQAASDNYLCPRCAPDAKPAAAPRPSGKRPSVKVTCPYCGAQFSGSIPTRPAKGGCPVCRKELVLLPEGTIQAAATFNLTAWQKEREARKAESSRAVAPAPEPPPEMPTVADPLGGSTILDMGGPAGGAASSPLPSLDEPTMAMPGGLGGETMLGMGSHEPPPAPSIDETAPPPPPERGDDEPPELPPDLGGATILDMGPRPVELPPPEIDEPGPKSDLLSEMMPGMDRPPSAESPVSPPTPPPVPEETESPPESDVTDVPTDRGAEEPAPEPTPGPEPEPVEASTESSPEIPVDMGGQTMLGIGGQSELDAVPREGPPSIEETPPEAVPILAKDMGDSDPPPESSGTPDPGDAAPGQEPPKSYVYQPIPRVPRQSTPSIAPPTPPPAPPPIHRDPPPGVPTPKAPTDKSAPVLGSDFRIASAPPAPQPSEPAKGGKKPAGPVTAAIVLPRAHHSLGKLLIAWVILLLPAGAGFALYSLQKTEAVEKIIRKLSSEALPGFRKVDVEIRKAVSKPAELPAEPPPK